MENSNYFQQILISTWNLFNTEFTIYGFTLSYAKVFLFSLLACFCMRAVYILWFE